MANELDEILKRALETGVIQGFLDMGSFCMLYRAGFDGLSGCSC